MNIKIKHSLLAIAAILILCGCERQQNYAQSKNVGIYLIDTLDIHGESHEIIHECSRGGIMHSPECWCGKRRRGDECGLKGFKRNCGNQLMGNFIIHKGRYMSERDTRVLVNYAIEQGYETIRDVPDKITDK